MLLRRLSSSLPRRTALAIPDGAIEFKFVRSSGPGGQHVNKTSSACEGRLAIKEAFWLPEDVKARLIEQQNHRLNTKYELVVCSQQERSSHRNREIVVQQMQAMIDEALVEPKVRELISTPSEQTKKKWTEEKRERSKIKALRRSNFRDEF